MEKNLTKRRMADAFRQLMDKKAFSSISISDICDECNMHRKSFYYHFKDKYDLVAWIYNDDVGCNDDGPSSTHDAMSRLAWLLNYLHNNREYYSKLLHIEGQNSFREHFSHHVEESVSKILTEMFPDETIEEYQVEFVAQGMVSVVLQWVKDKDEISPQQLSDRLVSCYRLIGKLREKL